MTSPCTYAACFATPDLQASNTVWCLREEVMRQPVSAELGVPPVVMLVIHIHNAKPWLVAFRPFEVVDQAPCKIGTEVHIVFHYSSTQVLQVAPA